MHLWDFRLDCFGKPLKDCRLKRSNGKLIYIYPCKASPCEAKCGAGRIDDKSSGE